MRPLARALFVLIISLMLLWIQVGSLTAAAPTHYAPELAIPNLGIAAPIVHLPLEQMKNGSYNWDTSRLRWKAGYLEGTAYFGQGGNTVLGGHSEWGRRRDIFYDLHQLQVGSTISVYTNEQTLQYQVVAVSVVDISDVSVLYGTGGEQLTLITCDKTSRQRGGVYTRRIIVTANRI